MQTKYLSLHQSGHVGAFDATSTGGMTSVTGSCVIVSERKRTERRLRVGCQCAGANLLAYLVSDRRVDNRTERSLHL